MNNFREHCNPENGTPIVNCPSYGPRLITNTILKCGNGMGAGPLSLSYEDRHHEPRIIASVTLDTRKLMDPTVKIDFASIISFETTNIYYYELRLVFRLIKVCKEGSPVTLGEWTFEKANHHGGNSVAGVAPEAESQQAAINGSICNVIEESNSFCFSWCECGDCPDCCRYVVEIIHQEGCAINKANISDVVISGMAVGFTEMES